MHFIHVVGARPNFMKAAPVMAAFDQRPNWRQSLVHTGQHYDRNMSEVFFGELGLPKPDINLDVGSGSHAGQTAEVMKRFEAYVLEAKPDWVLVYGDVNSTVAVSLVCAKLHIPVAHVEAGLRSFDRRMPEEINRLVTDSIANLLLTPSIDGNEHLAHEGVAEEQVHLVGNVMIDTLVRLKPKAEERWPKLSINWGLADQGYSLITLHRPSNVDDPEYLPQLMAVLADLSTQLPALFPVHPRTRQRLAALNIAVPDTLRLIDPVGYLDFLALQAHARLVITDSGGVQEETTYLGVPCFTMRENTERPVTVDVGTNILLGRDLDGLRTGIQAVLTGHAKQGGIPKYWDGQAGERIAQVFENIMAP